VYSILSIGCKYVLPFLPFIEYFIIAQQQTVNPLFDINTHLNNIKTEFDISLPTSYIVRGTESTSKIMKESDSI
jgi:hypothetical protein